MPKLTTCHTGAQRGSHRGLKQRLEQFVDRVLAGPSEAQAGQRYASLGERKQPRRIRQQIERGLRARLSLLGQGAQAALANRNQRDFRGGKEAVEQQHGGQNHETIGHTRAKTRR